MWKRHKRDGLTTMALMLSAWEGFIWHSCLRASVLRLPPMLSSSWRSPFFIRPLHTEHTTDISYMLCGEWLLFSEDVLHYLIKILFYKYICMKSVQWFGLFKSFVVINNNRGYERCMKTSHCSMLLTFSQGSLTIVLCPARAFSLSVCFTFNVCSSALCHSRQTAYRNPMRPGIITNLFVNKI